jgi:transcriptional regulator with XRE-family HTH domain/tetratricopeptide (TPR) repeat protein
VETGSGIGRRVRQIRKAKGKSLAVVAGLAGISVSHLSNLELGRRNLDSVVLVEALAAALDVAPSELTGLPAGDVDVARVALSWLVDDSPIRLHLRAGRRIGDHLTDELADQVIGLRHADDVTSSVDLLPAVSRALAEADHLARTASYSEPVGIKLFTVVGELAQLGGWLHFDAGLHAAAENFYIASLRASASAHDPQVGAHTLNYLAIQTYSQGNPQDAVNLIRTAQEHVSRHTTARVRSLLHARAGRALSKTGDRTGSARAFDAARHAFAAGPDDNDPPWAYSITDGEIEMLAGSSALDLHDPRHALDRFAAARAAAYATVGHVRDGALYLTRTAQAHLNLGDLDAACAAGTEVLAHSSGAGESRPSQAIRDLRQQMIPHRHVRVVKDFLALSA